MPITKSLLIISEEHNDITELRSKLVLLRDVDSIINTNFANALSFSHQYQPDTIVVFAHRRRENTLNICKRLKGDELLKDIPIICIFNSYDEDFVLSCFDSGINDYLVRPVNDTEFLMRTLWCLQKSDLNRELEKKNALLEKLNLIDETTKSYNLQVTVKVIENEITIAQKYNHSLVLMAISLNAKCKSKANDIILAKVIKDAIRYNDILGSSDQGKYFVILPKTNLKGAYTVSNRIRKELDPELIINTGICEYSEQMNAKDFITSANNALNDALSRGDNKVILIDNLDQSIDAPLEPYRDGTKNYDLFKEEFADKIIQVISPVFREAKGLIQRNLSTENIVVDEFSTTTKCFFSIKDQYSINEAILKVVDPGFSKVILDTFIIKDKNKSNKRSTLELDDLTRDTLKEHLDDLLKEFMN